MIDLFKVFRLISFWSLLGWDSTLKKHFFVFDFQAIIDFNLWRMTSSVSGQYLGKRLDCSHIAHTHALWSVDVPFWGYDL